MTGAFLTGALFLWAVGATLAYARADHHRRDAWTDLSVLIHQLELTEDDLRRTRDHDPIQDSLNRAWDDGD